MAERPFWYVQGNKLMLVDDAARNNDGNVTSVDLELPETIIAFIRGNIKLQKVDLVVNPNARIENAEDDEGDMRSGA